MECYLNEKVVNYFSVFIFCNRFPTRKKAIELTNEAVISELERSDDTYETELSGVKFKEFLITDCIDSVLDKENGGNRKK